MFLRKKTVRLEIRNEKLRDQLSVIIASIDGFLIQSVHDTMPSDLLVLEIGDDTIRDFDTLNRARATNKAREFFITCKSTNPDVLIQAMRIGVKEFIPQPVNEAELRKALLRLRDGSEPTPGRAKGARAQGADHQCPGRQGRRRDDDDRREPRRQPRAARRDARRWPSST